MLLRSVRVRSALSMGRRNLPYLRQQVCAAVASSSPVVKLICGAVTLVYVLCWAGMVWGGGGGGTEDGDSTASAILDALAATPGYLLPPNFRLWTAFTHCFVELHLWQVAADVLVVGLGGKLLEPLWGPLEMLVFFAAVNCSVALLCTAACLAAFTAGGRDPDALFAVRIHGLSGYVAAVAVAVKQLMPDHVLCATPLGRVRNRNVPLAVLLAASLLATLRLIDAVYPCMVAAGILSGWTYLRFVQQHPNGSRGDLADSFTFASFFPNVLQPAVGVVCNTVFECLVRVGLCRRPVRKYDVGAPSSITISLPGTDPHDAERRRQIALKALSERLSKPETHHPPWPSMVDPHHPPTSPPTPTSSSSAAAAAAANPLPPPSSSSVAPPPPLPPPLQPSLAPPPAHHGK